MRGLLGVQQRIDRAAAISRQVYSSSDSEIETEDDDDYEDISDDATNNEIDLPSYFLGRLIYRSNLNDDNDDNITSYRQVTPPRPPTNLHVNTSSSAARSSSSNNERNNNDDDSNHPPSPWGSSKSKQQIIDELKDDTSDIHLQIGAYTDDDFKDVNFKFLHQHYAGNKYKHSNFRENLKRLLKHFKNKTGPFKPEKEEGQQEEDIVEPWYTSVNNVSKAYTLLFLLHMNKTKSRVLNQMAVEDIWRSSPEFQKYELEKFKTYLSNMKKLTNKRKELIEKEEAAYEMDMLTLPHADLTSRGIPFWNRHDASKLLKEDEANGTAKSMKPKQLWQSRKEYQDFPLSVFRKHIYQERMKNLAAPFWQYKRNKAAKKKFEDAEEKMKEWNEDYINRQMYGIDLEKINLGD